MSASLALLNRIKSLETQKKRNNQLSSTAIKAAAAAASSSAAIPSTQLYGNVPNHSYRTASSSQRNSGYNQLNTSGNLNTSDHQYNENFATRDVSPMASPSSERRSAKYR